MSDEDRVSAHSYGKLDVSSVSDECWILRIPQKLFDTWDNLPEGTDLGELIFTKGGVDSSGKKIPPKFEVKVAQPAETSSASASNLPLNYSLQAMSKKIPRMHPFTRNPNNGSTKLLGTITRTANLQVEQDSRYKAMIKDRLLASNVTSNRFVKPAEATNAEVSHQIQARKEGQSFATAVHNIGQKILEAKQERLVQLEGGPAKKRSRQFAPDQPLKSVIFELFQSKQYWSVKDMKTAAAQGGCDEAATKKGEAKMREILREIGEYHRSGDHKNEWELRAEYQQQL